MYSRIIVETVNINESTFFTGPTVNNSKVSRNCRRIFKVVSLICLFDVKLLSDGGMERSRRPVIQILD